MSFFSNNVIMHWCCAVCIAMLIIAHHLIQTGKTITIRLSRGPIECPPDIPLHHNTILLKVLRPWNTPISQHYRIEGFKGSPKLFLHYSDRRQSLEHYMCDRSCFFFRVASLANFKKCIPKRLVQTTVMGNLVNASFPE